MKLRFSENHIRFRLSPEDVQELSEKSVVVMSIEFSTQQKFQYKIQLSAEHTAIFLDWKDSDLTVWVPESLAGPWILSKREGLYQSIQIGTDKSTLIAIERDLDPKH